MNTSHIQSIVEKGCPNVFRKPVNSAKRLRAHLKLDEGDVSISCDMHDKKSDWAHLYSRIYVLVWNFDNFRRAVRVICVAHVIEHTFCLPNLKLLHGQSM